MVARSRVAVMVALVVACGGAPQAAAPASPVVEAVEPAETDRSARALSEAELLDVSAVAAVLRDHGFAIEVIDDKHILIENDGEREGRYLLTPHADQRLLHITKMYVLRRRAEDRPRLLALCNEVNGAGIVKTYLDGDGDLALEGYLRVYGPMPASAVVAFAHVFHARAVAAAQPFFEFASTGGHEPGFGDGPD